MNNTYEVRQNPESNTTWHSPLVDVHTHYLWIFSEEAREFRRSMGLEGMESVRDSAGNIVGTAGGVPMIVYEDSTDIAKQVSTNEAAGITRRPLSVPMMIELFSNGHQEIALPLARQFNNNLADVVSRYPGQLVGLGNVCALDRRHLYEARRCIEQLGFAGILIDTSWHGEFPDSEDAYPFWQWAEEEGIPIFLHPPALPIGHEKMNRYKLEEAIGRPFDTAMSVAQLIFSGVLDQFPELNLVLAHIGGGLGSVIGRLDMGHCVGYEGMPANAIPKCKLNPSDYLRRNFWVDTMGFSAAYLRDAIELFSTDRVMLGTDYGPVPITPREHVDIVKSLKLPEEDEAKILWKNANDLYKLRLEEPAPALAASF
jgi:predicted TIM-barrel fold metal-dependent hydrolase